MLMFRKTTFFKPVAHPNVTRCLSQPQHSSFLTKFLPGLSSKIKPDVKHALDVSINPEFYKGKNHLSQIKMDWRSFLMLKLKKQTNKISNSLGTLSTDVSSDPSYMKNCD